MTTTPNGTVAPDDGQGIPADLLADGQPVVAEPTPEEAAARKAEAEKQELYGRLRAQEDMIRDQKRMLAELGETVKTIGDRTKAVDDRSQEAQIRGWQYAIDETRARMRKAAAEADVAAHDAAERDLDLLLRNSPVTRGPEPKAAAELPRQDIKVDPDIVAWLGVNPWYNSDWESRALFDGVYADLSINKPGMSTKERLAEAKSRVEKRLPDKFPTSQARKAPPAVSAPGPQGVKPKPKAKTEADLPPEARDIMERQVKRGLLTKEQYLKDFPWDK